MFVCVGCVSDGKEWNVVLKPENERFCLDSFIESIDLNQRKMATAAESSSSKRNQGKHNGNERNEKKNKRVFRMMKVFEQKHHNDR